MFPCSTQLSIKFYLLINSKLNRIVFWFNLTECDIFCASEYENVDFSWHFHIYQQRKRHAHLTILYVSLQYYTVNSRNLKHCYLKVVSTKKEISVDTFSDFVCFADLLTSNR